MVNVKVKYNNCIWEKLTYSFQNKCTSPIYENVQVNIWYHIQHLIQHNLHLTIWHKILHEARRG